MERREKKQQLEIERQKELDSIYDKYADKFRELNYVFNIKDIEADGWVKGSYHPIRGSENEWEYKKRIPTHEFWTRTITIDFDEKDNIKQIFTYSGCPTRTIIDMEDLNYFFETNS